MFPALWGFLYGVFSFYSKSSLVKPPCLSSFHLQQRRRVTKYSL